MLTNQDGSSYCYNRPPSSNQDEAKRAAEKARRSAQAQISVPDRLSAIEDKLSRILIIFYSAYLQYLIGYLLLKIS